MNDYLYIGPDMQILRGKEAQVALGQRNDSQWVHHANGIAKVSRERWLEAQATEHHHWFDAENRVGDDRNFLHAELFGNYRSLKGRQFRTGIELGCGAFTNMRIIARRVSLAEVDLLDPLLEEYFTHRNRYIDRDSLTETLLFSKFPRIAKRAPELWRRIAQLTGLTTPVRNTFNCSIEEFQPEGTYDLIVMLNVLEHCQDVQQIIDKILACSHSGTTLVFADRVYDALEVAEMADCLFDAAHPLRITLGALDELLAAFPADYRLEVAASEPLYARTKELYYIGQRA